MEELDKPRTYYTWYTMKPRAEGDFEPLMVLDIDSLDDEGHQYHRFSPKQAFDLAKGILESLKEQGEAFGYNPEDPPDWDVRLAGPFDLPGVRRRE